MEAWEPLFDKAMQALDSLPRHVPPPDWTFGGGTVLMRKYHHRLSRDVDIFLTDSQYLTLFSPRLNDAIADMTTQYREDSQHVKLTFGNLGEVDFVAAPRLIENSKQADTIHGRKVWLDKPEEIIAKKCFYRADGFTARDVFDLAVFLSKDHKAAKENLGIITARRHEIQRRLDLYTKNPVQWTHEIGKVQPLPGFSTAGQKALATVQKFYQHPEKWLKSREFDR